MKMSEILHERGSYWILKDIKNKCYTVFKSGITHSVSDSAYPLDDDGLSIAKARVDYLARREAEMGAP